MPNALSRIQSLPKKSTRFQLRVFVYDTELVISVVMVNIVLGYNIVASYGCASDERSWLALSWDVMTQFIVILLMFLPITVAPPTS
jgi:hypothetical protein